MSDSNKPRPAALIHLMPRYGEIFQVLFKYGFWDVCGMAKLQGILEMTHLSFAEEARELGEKPIEERVRLAFEDLGPTFVKVGQMLSSRRDLVEDRLYEELRKLQKEVKPVPWEEIREEMVRELGRPLDEVFSSIEQIPFAAASIAQVHRAILRREGVEVAVKVRRPNIRKTVNADIEVMRHFADFLEKHVPDVAVFHPAALVEDFARSLRRELNFEWETDQQKEFARLFGSEESLHIPLVFEDYCSEGLLVSEYAPGLPVDQPEQLREKGIDTTELAQRMTRMVFRMIFELGFFHADPHPGNMSVEPDGSVVLYDFGWMGRFSESFRESLAMAIHGMVNRDGARLTEALLGMSEDGHVQDTSILQRDLALFSAENLDRPLNEICLEETLNQLLSLLRRHQLRMRPEFYTGVKALSQVEAVARTLDPEINYIRLGKPYAQAVFEEQFSPKRLMKTFYWSGLELASLLRELPLEVRNFIGKWKKGELRVPVRHEIDQDGFEPLRATMNHIANRMAVALLAAALLITSGLLLHAPVGPLWGSLPAFGVASLLGGLFLTIRLIWSIWRRGGM